MKLARPTLGGSSSRDAVLPGWPHTPIFPLRPRAYTPTPLWQGTQPSAPSPFSPARASLVALVAKAVTAPASLGAATAQAGRSSGSGSNSRSSTAAAAAAVVHEVQGRPGPGATGQLQPHTDQLQPHKGKATAAVAQEAPGPGAKAKGKVAAAAVAQEVRGHPGTGVKGPRVSSAAQSGGTSARAAARAADRAAKAKLRTRGGRVLKVALAAPRLQTPRAPRPATAATAAAGGGADDGDAAAAAAAAATASVERAQQQRLNDLYQRYNHAAVKQLLLLSYSQPGHEGPGITLGLPWACRLQLAGGVGPGGRQLPVVSFEGVGRRKGDAQRVASAAAWRYLEEQGYGEEPPDADLAGIAQTHSSKSLPGSGSAAVPGSRSASAPRSGTAPAPGFGSETVPGSGHADSMAPSAGARADATAAQQQQQHATAAVQPGATAMEQDAAAAATASLERAQQGLLHGLYHRHNPTQVKEQTATAHHLHSAPYTLSPQTSATSPGL